MDLPFADQTLEDGAVLGCCPPDRGSRPLHAGLGDQLTATTKVSLFGQCDVLACFDGRHRGPQPGIAEPTAAPVRCPPSHGLFQRIRTSEHLDALRKEDVLGLFQLGGIPELTTAFGLNSNACFTREVHVVATGKQFHLEMGRLFRGSRPTLGFRWTRSKSESRSSSCALATKCSCIHEQPIRSENVQRSRFPDGDVLLRLPLRLCQSVE